MGINLKLKRIIMRCEENANDEWKAVAERRVRYLASKRVPFTSEDVINYLNEKGYKTHNNSALGAIMLRSSKDGRIVKLGWEEARRKSRHGAPVRIWIGTGGNL